MTVILRSLANQRRVLIADLLSSDAIRSRHAYATQLRSDPSLKRIHAKNISVAYRQSSYRFADDADYTRDCLNASNPLDIPTFAKKSSKGTYEA